LSHLQPNNEISGFYMSIRKAYSDWSATYDTDRNLTRDLDQQVTREQLSQRRYTSILELGCGTGKNTALLVDLAVRVIALDFSEGMIAQAKAKLTDKPVLFSVANLTQTWPCKDHSIDLMTCNLVLEHIDDLNFIFAEAVRVLIPGGLFFISELHPFKQYEGKKATFQHNDQQTEIDAFIHHISDFGNAAQQAGLTLRRLNEWWHDEDQQIPPRLMTLLFERA
jgi:ubiquinone/menaquinone biosynthesis C-methylase UbiE